ncbi:hypothetical protein GCM10018952_44560 [Streptosporangium vulgare]
MADGTGFFRGAGGSVWEMDLPLGASMQEQLTKGYLARVNEDGSPFTEEPEVEQPPAPNASKGTWVGYAHRVHGASIDDAEAMTKTDLVERYGAKA